MAPPTRSATATATVTISNVDTPIASSLKSVATSPYSTPTSVTSEERRKPLSAAKLIVGRSAGRRHKGVVFSPHNDTRLFVKDQPLVAETATPLSIRSYDSSSSPVVDSPSTRSSRENTPVRSILKQKDRDSIRIASSHREGSYLNREAARLVVTGQRPRTSPRGSSSLALLCGTAEDGVAAGNQTLEEEPPSDDINATGDGPSSDRLSAADDYSEEEEQVECLHPGSLVNVILEGSEDLLTLEEAYITMTNKLRETLYGIGPATLEAQSALERVIEPIVEEAPSLVRAITRDLQRLMGKVPHSEADTSTIPFRGLLPSRGSRYPPSPSSSPRKGYTASEVLYRREASSVGAAVLRFLSVVYSSPRVYNCFTAADMQALLDLVLIIPKTPVLPTPSPKRTYSLTMVLLASIRVPADWLEPSRDKVMGAVESALSTLGMGPPPYAFKDPDQVKRDACFAVAHLLKEYPRLFFTSFASFLQPVLRSLAGPVFLRRAASFAVAAFVSTKLRISQQRDLEVESGELTEEAWATLGNVIRESESTMYSWFKGPAKYPGRIAGGDAGKRRNEWFAIELTFRQTVGTQSEVAWACSTWATLVNVLGQSYYSTSLASLMDHIIDRSLQASTNTIRPSLGCEAWQHAIYAYLLAGSSSSVDQSGRVVRWHNPFVASPQQDAAGRAKMICFPVTLALAQAHNAERFARILKPRGEFNNEQRWGWHRAEKPRKRDWMVTCGRLASAITFGYTVVALTHREATAHEISRSSGLPSSDGVVPDLTPEEQRIPLLDRAFEIISPILKKSFSVCGVDPLKVQAWDILAAITDAPTASTPSLERLLSRRFLGGDLMFKEYSEEELVHIYEQERVQPQEIPGWGRLWVAKRLGKLLSLFQDAFDGMRGISDLGEVKWVAKDDELVLFPEALSKTWENMLRALAMTGSTSSPTPLYVYGLQAVTKQLLVIFDRDPTSYIPICLLNADGKSTLDVQAVRLRVFHHLYALAHDILGEQGLGATKLGAEPEMLQGYEQFGSSTASDYLLSHILCAVLVLSPLDKKAQPLFLKLVGSLLHTGAVQGTRMLGAMTNKMPWILENNEELQLAVWRQLALQWVASVDVQPSQEASTTNHTGALLVSLLSGPFRNGDAASVWYANPSEQNIDAWKSLLEAAVLRFRAKRAGSNFGVIETLAAHLEDFVRVDNEQEDGADLTKARMSSATTLSCLAAATSWISFVPTEHYHASHFSINENYIPVDFLTCVSDYLKASYPHSAGPATVELVDQLRKLATNLPAEAVDTVLENVGPGVALWMTDEEEKVDDDLTGSLDSLYIDILAAVTRAIESGAIPRDSDSMNRFIYLYAPRLSRARSAAVPTAFQMFWRSCFQDVSGLDYSDDVAGFLRDIICSLPGFITAEGLSLDEGSQVTAESFPFAQSVPPQERPRPAQAPVIVEDTILEDDHNAEQEVEDEVSQDEIEADDANITTDVPVDEIVTGNTATAQSITPEIPPGQVSADYDADESSPAPSMSKRKRPEAVEPSPLVAESEVDSPAASKDVFGPTKKSKASRRVRGRGGKFARRSRASSRQSESAESSPRPSEDPEERDVSPTALEAADQTVIVETDVEIDLQGTPPNSQDLRHAHGSLLSSARGWLRKVPSLSSLFSPTFDPPGDEFARRASEAAGDVAEETSSEASSSPCPSTHSTPREKLPRTKRTRTIPSEPLVEQALDLPEALPVQEDVEVPEVVVAALPGNAEIVEASQEGPEAAVRRSTRRSKAAEPAPAEPAAPIAEDQVDSEKTKEPPALTRSAARRKRGSQEDEVQVEPSTASKRRRLDRSASVVSQVSQTSRASQEPSSERTSRRLAKAKTMPTAVVQETVGKGRQSKSMPDVTEVAEDEEDELLLSPESAARMRQEEADEISAARRERREKPSSQEASSSREISGVFDDAPGDKTPQKPAEDDKVAPRTPSPIPEEEEDDLPSPKRRTTAQKRVLAALENAVKDISVIDNLDLEGTRELIRNLNALRDAATDHLLTRAEAERPARRRSRAYYPFDSLHS